MTDVTDLAPSAPAYIGTTACQFLGGADASPNGITLHSRREPCGHADPDAMVPTFVGFVTDAAAGRRESVEPCRFCGDAIKVSSEPVETPPDGGTAVEDGNDWSAFRAARDAAPEWTPGGTADDSENGPTRTCLNCGAQVSKRYVDVREPEGIDQPRTCPDCELVRERDGTVREPRNREVS